MEAHHTSGAHIKRSSPISQSNKIPIKLSTILKSLDIKLSTRQVTVRELILPISKIALLTSFRIFKLKDEPQWCDHKLITFTIFTRYT